MSNRPTITNVGIYVNYTIPTWSANPVDLSENCAPKGDGVCDGTDDDLDRPCECPCHEVNNLPHTTAAVKAWHDDLHAGRLTLS